MLRRLDLFPKYADPEIKVKTNMGAFFSVCTIAVMVALFLHEVHRYVFVRVFDEIIVDTSRIGLQRTMPIQFNITIFNPCNNIHVGAYDYKGSTQSRSADEIRKQRVDENGLAIGARDWLTLAKRSQGGRDSRRGPAKPAEYCGSCYGAGAKGQCCNSCEAVISAFEAKNWSAQSLDRWAQCVEEGYAAFGRESCVVTGWIRVARVRGSVFVSLVGDTRPGAKRPHDLSRLSTATNLSHRIHEFQIGTKVAGAGHALDGLAVVQVERGLVAYNYHLRVVPMRRIGRDGFEIHTFDFVPTFSRKNITERMSRDVPGIFFHYDIEPAMIVSRETAYTLWQLVCSVCAIVGGAFTCALFADQFMFRTLSTLAGKRGIGKDG